MNAFVLRHVRWLHRLANMTDVFDINTKTGRKKTNRKGQEMKTDRVCKMDDCSGHFQFSNIFFHRYLRVHLYLASVANELYNHLSLGMVNIGGKLVIHQGEAYSIDIHAFHGLQNWQQNNVSLSCDQWNESKHVQLLTQLRDRTLANTIKLSTKLAQTQRAAFKKPQHLSTTSSLWNNPLKTFRNINN